MGWECFPRQLPSSLRTSGLQTGNPGVIWWAVAAGSRRCQKQTDVGRPGVQGYTSKRFLKYYLTRETGESTKFMASGLENRARIDFVRGTSGVGFVKSVSIDIAKATSAMGADYRRHFSVAPGDYGRQQCVCEEEM